MSLKYRRLISFKSSVVIFHYPLLSNLYDVMGGANAMLERASKKLFYSSDDSMCKWVEEDEPAFESNGLFIERQDTNRYRNSQNLLGTGWLTEHGGSVSNVSFTDETGATRNVSRLSRASGRISRDQSHNASGGTNGEYIALGATMLIPEDVQSNYNMYAFPSGARATITLNKTTHNITTTISGIIGWSWTTPETRVITTGIAGNWVMFDVNAQVTNWGSLRIGVVNSAPSGAQEMYVGNVWLTDDHGSIIVSDSARATRARDRLIISGGSDPLSFSIKFETRFYRSVRKPQSLKYGLVRMNGGEFAVDVALLRVGTKVHFRVYFGDSDFITQPTDYDFTYVETVPFTLTINYGPVIGASRGLSLDYKVANDEEVKGDFYPDIPAAYLDFDNLEFATNVGVGHSDGYIFTERSRYLKAVVKTGVAV